MKASFLQHFLHYRSFQSSSINRNFNSVNVAKFINYETSLIPSVTQSLYSAQFSSGFVLSAVNLIIFLNTYCLMFPSFQSVVICHGGRIGFFQGDIRLLPDDMKALRPTIFPVVPRLLNRMYDKVSRRTDQTHSQRCPIRSPL